MWQSLKPNWLIAWDLFTDFLGDGTQQEAWKESHSDDDSAPTVLDIIEFWLQSTDDIRLIASHGDLLCAIVHMVDDWAGSGGTRIGQMTLWSVNGPEQPLQFFRQQYDPDREYEEHVTATHPVLSESVFNARKAWVQQFSQWEGGER